MKHKCKLDKFVFNLTFDLTKLNKQNMFVKLFSIKLLEPS